jgi:hypothetical protein
METSGNLRYLTMHLPNICPKIIDVIHRLVSFGQFGHSWARTEACRGT